ncbi:ArsA family ATPase [Anaerolineales bacterium HSG25]|nr:ArsA family ATPase [Anaerolineales bacterium HSG25]
MIPKTRIILFTGKGGVGKTTISAATALRAAEMGYKTLVISTDPAHSLADALDCQIGPEPTKLRPNLYAQELDVYYSIKKYWGNMREVIMSFVKWQGVERVIAEEMAILPGMEETSAFMWLEHFYQSGEYDLIIVDSAPTGETLKHLTLPQVSQWWVTRGQQVPLKNWTRKGLGTMVQLATGVPLNEGLAELQLFYNKLQSAQKIMSNSDICTIRIVLNPERMVIQEALRAYTYLQLYGYPVDSIIVNRILPEDSGQAVFGEYLEAQKGYLNDIDHKFEPLPIFRVPHSGREVFGLDRLRDIAEQVYAEQDPRQIFFNEKPYQFVEQTHGYLLMVRLPSLQDEEVSVTQREDELIIQAKQRRHNLFLPRFLTYYHVTNSQMVDGQLLVRFEKKYDH